MQSRDRLVQILARPLRKPWIDRLLEMEVALGHPAGRRDHDDHHELRLEQEHLDADDRRGLERRGRHECEQARDVRQHLRGRLERVLDLGALRVQVEREVGRRLRLRTLQQPVGVQPVAALGRNAAGRGVRMREQPQRFQLGELGAHGGRPGDETDPVGEGLGPDRLAGRDVLLHEATENLLLTGGEVHAEGHLQGF